PKEVITLLNQEVIKIVMLPDTKERMAALGFEPVANTPDGSAFQIRAEIAKWAKIIRAANIKSEYCSARRRYSINPVRRMALLWVGGSDLTGQQGRAGQVLSDH